jgi:hypothetical protein
MRIAGITLVALAALGAAAIHLGAQGIKLPGSLDKLAEKADESVEVTLDKSMLRLTSRFLDERDEAEIKKLVGGLDSIYVRSFEFAKEGEYSAADVEAVRSQLQAPAWSRIVGIRSKRTGEDADVYFKNAGNGQLGGIVVIAAEARELTIVEINGTLDPERLVDLGGEFGIPRLTARGVRREDQ